MGAGRTAAYCMLFPDLNVLGWQVCATVRQLHSSDLGDGPSWGGVQSEGLLGSVER